MPDADLARRDGVELVKTGRWEAQSGTWEPTPEDLAAAVEAQSCPAIRRPIVKLGHVDSRFDGEPALGWFENLRVADGGHTLVGDQVTLPWLSSVQAAAYPSRSVEGNYRHRCSEGHTHRFVLTAVALLGVTPPAVKTIRNLNDLPAMLGVAASEPEVPEGAEHVQVTIMAAGRFDESKHKRDGDGQFARKAGGDADAADGKPAAGPGRKVRLRDADGKAVHLELTDGALSLRIPYDGDDSDDGDDDPERQVDHFDTLRLDADTTTEWAEDLEFIAQQRDAYVKKAKAAAARMDQLDSDTGSAEYKQAQDAWFEIGGDGQRIAGGEVDGVDGTLVYEMRMGDDVADTQFLIGLRPKDAGGDWDLQEAASDLAGGFLPMTGFRRLMKELGVTPVKASASPDLPAAEPEQVINPDPKEGDPVSTTDLSGHRSRLGLSDDAEMDAVLEAYAAKLTEAETKTPEPTPEMVAASAAAVKTAEELAVRASKAEDAQAGMREELTKVRSELDTIKASAAQTVKASAFDRWSSTGRLKPADRETWEQRYDRDPEMVTEILDGRGEGSEVPVMASGVTGPAEPTGTDTIDAEYERLFGEKAGA